MLTRENIMQNLKNGIVNLEFQKKDGTIREMTATLDEKLFSYVPSENSTKKKSTDALAVWDTEALAWRSFRWSSLRKVNNVELTDGV